MGTEDTCVYPAYAEWAAMRDHIKERRRNTLKRIRLAKRKDPDKYNVRGSKPC